MTEKERHRAPALWVVVAGLAAAVAVARVVGAFEGLLLVVVTLGGCAVARVVRRGRQPEGVAVRSTWQDAAVLLVLAAAIAILATTPGVDTGAGGVPRSGGAQERVPSSSSSSDAAGPVDDAVAAPGRAGGAGGAVVPATSSPSSTSISSSSTSSISSSNGS